MDTKEHQSSRSEKTPAGSSQPCRQKSNQCSCGKKAASVSRLPPNRGHSPARCPPSAGLHDQATPCQLNPPGPHSARVHLELVRDLFVRAGRATQELVDAPLHGVKRCRPQRVRSSGRRGGAVHAGCSSGKERQRCFLVVVAHHKSFCVLARVAGLRRWLLATPDRRPMRP